MKHQFGSLKPCITTLYSTVSVLYDSISKYQMLLLDQAQITGLQQKLHVTNNSEYQENTNTTSDEDFYQPENTVLDLLC